MSYNEENVRLWVEALESGEYEQDPKGGALRRANDTYCCLGVACEVGRLQGVIPAPRHPTDADDVFTYDGAVAVLPESLREWLGIPEGGGGNPQIGGVSAWTRNDEMRQTFPEIAAEIRKHWLGEDVD